MCSDIFLGEVTKACHEYGQCIRCLWTRIHHYCMGAAPYDVSYPPVLTSIITASGHCYYCCWSSRKLCARKYMCTKWIYQSSIFVPRTFTGTYPSPSSRRLVSCNFCVQVVSFEMDLKAKAKDPWNGACSCVTDTCQACAWRSSTSRKSKDPFQSCAFQSCAVCHAFVVKNKNKILIYHSTTHLYSKICRSRGSKVEHLSSEQKVAGSIPAGITFCSLRPWNLKECKLFRPFTPVVSSSRWE